MTLAPQMAAAVQVRCALQIPTAPLSQGRCRTPRATGSQGGSVFRTRGPCSRAVTRERSSKVPVMRWPRAMVAGGLALAGVLLATDDGRAQITFDGSLGPAGSLAGPNFIIGSDRGRTVGNNLFQSFGLFNVQHGESATFTGPGSIANVIGRVTGGQISTIDG